MEISLRRYILLFGALTAATPFVAWALITALPQYQETITDIFGIPVAFAITQSTAYYFFFRNRRLPSSREYWRLVGYCTAIGVGLALASAFLSGAFDGVSVGFIVFMLAMMAGIQFVVLAIAFSSFMGRTMVKSLEKAGAKRSAGK
ncbi:putative flippase GtrA [Aminobacter niigataensis]|uniref:Flippase GtrA n=1 Tax=Aminobacter niigataensis TaxID=83265 RepID=A0ABR6L086_9HYPH|nr:ABZJ_00895 family protein [Aminobacter niigataensis]MBB4649604.1 putative flippase GtrA [Aminobacter niigataensis]